LDLVLCHAGLNLLKVDVDEDVAMPIDLGGAASRKPHRAEREGD
jgi:hypothetical protein